MIFESFPFWLLLVFRVNFMSKNEHFFEKLNHDWKCGDQNKHFQTIEVTRFCNFIIF